MINQNIYYIYTLLSILKKMHCLLLMPFVTLIKKINIKYKKYIFQNEINLNQSDRNLVI